MASRLKSQCTEKRLMVPQNEERRLPTIARRRLRPRGGLNRIHPKTKMGASRVAP
jgi:hypothetical protein